jgi:Alpha/beta hydrolase of unknown function (DUF900)
VPFQVKIPIWLLVILLVFGATAGSPGLARASKVKTNYVSIPVNYVTDRELTGETFGPRRRYATDCQHHMYYGTAYVEVPNVDHKNDPALFKSLGWKISDERPAKISPKERIDPTDPAASKRVFMERLKAALDQAGDPTLCLYVHGAADGFEDCTQDAAQMAYALQKPIVLYSWPSDPRMRGYFVDSTDVEWSQGHFDQFLTDLMALQAVHPLEVVSISHSMGNRLVIRSLPVVYGKGLIKDWELVSPDMDADTCRHYVLGREQLNAKLRIYVSNRDKALPLASLLTGGYYRLGEAANPTYSANAKNVNSKLFERIDFTDLDTGFEGHKIPFQLISNMVSTDKPGVDLELVGESSVRGNRIARFAGRKGKYDSTSTEASFSKKVVRTTTK